MRVNEIKKIEWLLYQKEESAFYMPFSFSSFSHLGKKRRESEWGRAFESLGFIGNIPKWVAGESLNKWLQKVFTSYTGVYDLFPFPHILAVFDLGNLLNFLLVGCVKKKCCISFSLYFPDYQWNCLFICSSFFFFLYKLYFHIFYSLGGLSGFFFLSDLKELFM